MTSFTTGPGPKEQLAVVVGAGGMGMAIARRLAERYRVLLVDREIDRAEAGAAAIRADGGQAAVFGCDLGDPQQVVRLGERVAALGHFKALAHVAGLSPSAAD